MTRYYSGRNIAVTAHPVCQVTSSRRRFDHRSSRLHVGVNSELIRTYLSCSSDLLFMRPARIWGRLRCYVFRIAAVNMTSLWRHKTGARERGEAACCVVSAAPKVHRGHRVTQLSASQILFIICDNWWVGVQFINNFSFTFSIDRF